MPLPQAKPAPMTSTDSQNDNLREETQRAVTNLAQATSIANSSPDAPSTVTGQHQHQPASASVSGISAPTPAKSATTASSISTTTSHGADSQSVAPDGPGANGHTNEACVACAKTGGVSSIDGALQAVLQASVSTVQAFVNSDSFWEDMKFMEEDIAKDRQEKQVAPINILAT